MKTTTRLALFSALLLAAAGAPAAAQEKDGAAATLKSALAKDDVSKVDSILAITTDLSLFEISLNEAGAAKNPRLVRTVLQRTLDHQLLWLDDMDFTEQEIAAKARIAALALENLKKLGVAADDKALRDEKARAALLKNLKELKLPAATA